MRIIHYSGSHFNRQIQILFFAINTHEKHSNQLLLEFFSWWPTDVKTIFDFLMFVRHPSYAQANRTFTWSGTFSSYWRKTFSHFDAHNEFAMRSAQKTLAPWLKEATNEFSVGARTVSSYMNGRYYNTVVYSPTFWSKQTRIMFCIIGESRINHLAMRMFLHRSRQKR